jgi:hypothetical protein
MASELIAARPQTPRRKPARAEAHQRDDLGAGWVFHVEKRWPAPLIG